MLPVFIIEEIRKRERERLDRDDRPRLDLPLEPPPRPSKPSIPAPDGDPRNPPPEGDRAIVTIDFG